MKKSKLKIRIYNSSKWPTPFIELLSNWIIHERANIQCQNYTLILKHKTRGFSGHGGENHQTIRIDRKYLKGLYPYSFKDHRFKWAKTFKFQSPIEVLVFLMAHEAFHTFTGSKPYCNMKSCEREFHCNDFGFKTVEAYRQLPRNFSKIKKALRKSRKKITKQKEQKKKQNSPEHKLEVAQQRLTLWESKLKYTEHKIKHWQKKVKYYEKRIG